MTIRYPFCEPINLHVEGRIAPEDAARQTAAAREILRRLSRQPGLILADEVGMGKTFVALAVAVSVALADRKARPVVVMVPPSLKQKWPKDFALFKERCLPPELAKQMQYGIAERPVEFLKFLDDPPERRKKILFVTHGAMSRALFDKWVKLALIQHAISGRHGVAELRKTLSRFMPEILNMKSAAWWDQSVWRELLATHPRYWLKRMQRHGIDPDGNGSPDDPVPDAVVNVMDYVSTDDLYQTLKHVPKRTSANLEARIRLVRKGIQKCLKEVWEEAIKALRLRLPLVILDEAHHLKNERTQLASLFHLEEAREDVEVMTRGALGGVFERMLFLTATPFQLGHLELCSVLERFSGIAWTGPDAPEIDRGQFESELDALRRALDVAQLSALRLERAWGRLTPNDLVVNEARYDDVDTWWKGAAGAEALTETGRAVLEAYRDTKARMRVANEHLRPWVIRHLKPRDMHNRPNGDGSILRRQRLPGQGISLDSRGGGDVGLPVDGAALLPFLLAARAVTCAPDSRPVFAEGLASSYEAFLHTRNKPDEGDEPVTDFDDDTPEPAISTAAESWYLDNLENLLLTPELVDQATHPKLAATVARVVDLWSKGEKVLVFCHYVATGRVLRQRISEAIGRKIVELGTNKLWCREDDVEPELQRIGARFDDKDAPLRRACDQAVRDILASFQQLYDSAEDLQYIVRRFVRTPSFLVRYFPIESKTRDEDAMNAALETKDGSGMPLSELIRAFFNFLSNRCSEEERAQYIAALRQLQTGAHYGADVEKTYSPDELQGDRSEALLPNVRLVNGSTKHETRERIMLTFNTPFYPEVLVASSVMAEGVDLHLNCRFVIHHDLCWNPSTLEQRTGRIDRIGAKCEQSSQPIVVYLPYIGETQDEKMYRVVMDRERWFSVVMGEQYKVDARTTDKLAARLALPEEAARDLAFRLEVVNGGE